LNIPKDVHHGPSINGVAFTELLWAAANGTRHGLAWWQNLMSSAKEHFLSGKDADAFDPRAPYDKQQVRSVAVLVQGLGEKWETISPTPDICYDALERLSDGSGAAYVRRLLDVGAEIGKTNAAAKAALEEALAEL
jgi:hypothetical protein